METPSKKWFRLAPGSMVRLKNAYIVRCDSFEQDAAGRVTVLKGTYLPESKSGSDTSGLHVKGTIHWISIPHAITAEIRLYDRLFKSENPANEEGDFKDDINPDSLRVISNAFVEPGLGKAAIGQNYQFIRKGYFVLDKDSSPEKLVFNQTVTLKDTWAKEARKING